MAEKLAEAFVEITERGLSKVDGAISGLKTHMSALAIGATGLGGVFTAGALGAGLASCVHQFSEAEQASARLESVLKSTGAPWGLPVTRSVHSRPTCSGPRVLRMTQRPRRVDAAHVHEHQGIDLQRRHRGGAGPLHDHGAGPAHFDHANR